MAPLSSVVRQRLLRIMDFLCWRKTKSRGRGKSPKKREARGGLNLDPTNIPTTQAQLR
jgi:hypothetical protein